MLEFLTEFCLSPIMGPHSLIGRALKMIRSNGIWVCSKMTAKMMIRTAKTVMVSMYTGQGSNRVELFVKVVKSDLIRQIEALPADAKIEVTTDAFGDDVTVIVGG